MKIIFLALVLSQISALEVAHAQIDNVEKATVKSKDYNYTRRLKDYMTSLEDSFSGYINTLKKGDVWLDSGAGDALAQVDYLKRGGVATVIALDARQTENKETLGALLQFSLQFRYFQGRYTENYQPQELYPLKLITDVCGAIAYSSHLDRVLKVLLASLVPGGRLYFEMDDSTAPLQANSSDRLIINKVTDKGEVHVAAADYFNAIKGIEFKVGHAVYGGDTIGTYFVRTSEKLYVPSLEIKGYEAGSPPRKTYTWK